MASLSTDRLIHAAPEVVFDVATSIETWPELDNPIVKVELLTPGPVGLGTRFRETRVIFRREASEEMEFVEWNRPLGYVLLAESHGSRYRTTFTLTPEGDSTRLQMQFDATPLTFMAKIMSTLMKPLMKKMIDMCGKDLEAIKNHVEGLESK